MSTAPWQAQAATALREPLRHVVGARVVPGAGDPIDLPDEGLERAEVTFDEGWSPHVQATITCRTPALQQTLDRIDPRAGTRIVLSAGYTYPGGSQDVHQLADLCLRRRPVSRPENTIGLTACSDEVRLQDETPLGASHIYGPPTLVRDVIEDLVVTYVPGAALDVAVTSTATLGEELEVQTGDNLWGIVADLADRLEAWVYVDDYATWHVVDRPVMVSKSAHVLSVGPSGTITDSDADLDVTDWGNAVLVKYPGDVGFVYAEATTGPYAVTAVPRKVLTFTRETASASLVAREAVAAALLRRALSRGRGFAVTAPAAYWLRPGMTVTVQLPLGPQERHIVSRVTFDLLTGSMEVRTRVPDDSTITTSGG